MGTDMKRLSAPAFCCAFSPFAGPPAFAWFTDVGKHFAIDFPQGWSAPVTDAGGNAQSDSRTAHRA
jgi:hypothetical protein